MVYMGDALSVPFIVSWFYSHCPHITSFPVSSPTRRFGKELKRNREQDWSLIKGADDPFTIVYYINKTSLLDAALHFVLDKKYHSCLYQFIIQSYYLFPTASDSGDV